MLEKLYKKFGKRVVWIAAFILGVFLVIGLASLFNGEEEGAETEEAQNRMVETLSVSEFQNGALGIVSPSADGNSFVVRAESGGRVNRIGRIGAVSQGAVIAEVDNAAQRAALLQAQGVYEAALAAANRSDISVEDSRVALESAKEGVVSADRAALTAWTSVLYNTVDELFSNPRQQNPGVRIEAAASASRIGEARVEVGAVLEAWQKDSETISSNASVSSLVNTIETDIRRVDTLASLVDSFINLLPYQDVNEIFTESELARLQGSFAAARATLNSQKSALEGAKTALLRADEAVKSAEVGGTGGVVSAADAQIKQAQGAYQAAQAAYNKSLVRAPFAGRVTLLNVRVGDIISPGADVAIILPNEGVETESYFNLPLSAVKYTPDGALVFVINENNTLQSIDVETGLVTASYIQVKGLSGNEVIVKDVRGLKVGETVEVR